MDHRRNETMSVAEVEKEIRLLAELNAEQCKYFKKRIGDELRKMNCLPMGIRRNKFINQTLLSFLGQRDFSGLEREGVVLNHFYKGEKV